MTAKAISSNNDGSVRIINNHEGIEKARFFQMVKINKNKVLPFVAYLTDKATGMKFSNSFDTKEQAEEWIEKSKKLLVKGRNN